jgi:hypothetical protein
VIVLNPATLQLGYQLKKAPSAFGQQWIFLNSGKNGTVPFFDCKQLRIQLKRKLVYIDKYMMRRSTRNETVKEIVWVCARQ